MVEKWTLTINQKDQGYTWALKNSKYPLAEGHHYKTMLDAIKAAIKGIQNKDSEKVKLVIRYE